MSNQHDNIYNILGKLDALTPKQAPAVPAPAKTINESVEARGSVLAGVARVEARLAQQFAEANDWNKLGAEFRSTKPGTREPTHTGEKEYTKTGVRHHASKRYGGDRADDAETINSTGEKRGRGRPKKSQFEEGQVEEMFANNDDARVDAINAANPPKTPSPVSSRDPGRIGGPAIPVKHHTYDRKSVASNISGKDSAAYDYRGQVEEVQLDELSPELLKRARDKAGMKYADADDRRDQKASDKYNRLDDKFNSALRKKQKDMEEGNEFSGNRDAAIKAGQDEFEVDGKRYPVKENGLQRYTGIKKYGKKGFEALQKAGREGADEEEKGRIKDQYIKKEGVAESINFAEMMKEQHQTVDEYLMELQADIAEFKKSGHMSEKLRDSVEMHKFSKKQLTDAAKSPVLPVPVPAPKPQGVMGRMGSAIAGGVRSAASAVNRVVGHPSDAEMLDRLKKDTMKEELDELARLAGLSESLKGGQKKLDKNKNGHLDSDDFKRLRDKVDEATVDEDMIKSKKDDSKKDDDVEEGAGVMHFKNEKAKEAGKDSFKVGDEEFPVKEGKAKVDECGPEMSPFSSMGHAEAESGMSINSSMDTKTGRKTLSVTADGEAAEQLAQMLKMAGMGGGEAHSHQEPQAVVIQAGPEEAVEEEREGQYANTPDEEVENIDAIMHQGNDLNREKEQYANKPKAGDNPMATREGIEMPKSLSRMLEAIKMVEAEKCNHTDKGEKCPVHGMKECSYMEEAAKYRDPKYKDKLYTQEPPDYNDTREYDNAMWNPKPDDYPGRKELPGGGEYDRTDPLVKGQGIGRSGIKNNINLSGKRKGLPSRDQITSLKGSIKDAHGTHPRPNLPEAKPSAGMSKGEKSSLVKKAQAGGDIGKPGKSFDKTAKAAGGGEKGKKIAAAAMWKNAAK